MFYNKLPLVTWCQKFGTWVFIYWTCSFLSDIARTLFSTPKSHRSTLVTSHRSTSQFNFTHNKIGSLIVSLRKLSVRLVTLRLALTLNLLLPDNNLKNQYTRLHPVRIQHTKWHPMQSNPKAHGVPRNHKAPLPASGADAHHMQLEVVVLPPMRPVTAVANGVTGNKFAEHPLPTQWPKPSTLLLKPAPLMSQLIM